MNEINRFKFGTTWWDDQFDGEIAFRNMRGAFAEAATSQPSELLESFYIFAGQSVQVRVLGCELAEHINRPFLHLRTDRPVSRPRLTIELWDAYKTGTGSRADPFNGDAGWHEKTVDSGHARFVGEHQPHTVACLDRKSAHIMGSIAWHSRIFIYERAKPLARLLLHWHNDVNVQVIHTALIARANQGLLLAGKSGSGKSTSSLACVMAGFDYLGEDYVGLEACEDGSFVGHSLYNSVFLDTHHLGRFAQLAPYAIRGRPPHEAKSTVLLSQVVPQRLTRAVQIRALVLPHVTDAPDAELRPVSKGEALLALGPSSLLQIPNRALGARGFDRLAQLVERTPCFRMDMGSNLASIPRCLDALLATITS